MKSKANQGLQTACGFTLKIVKAKPSLTGTICMEAAVRHLTVACATTVLPLLLCVLPATGQAQFSYTTTIGGAIIITGSTCSVESETILSTIKGLPITGIGDSAFSGCSRRTSITLPNSVTHRVLCTLAFDGGSPRLLAAKISSALP